MEMARYILSILRADLMVLFSWGFHSAYAIENGLGFFVNGYIHKGRVTIEYNEGWDLFNVTTYNNDGSVKAKQEGIYADCLTTTVDAMVEKCPDYKDRVRKDYGLS